MSLFVFLIICSYVIFLYSCLIIGAPEATGAVAASVGPIGLIMVPEYGIALLLPAEATTRASLSLRAPADEQEGRLRRQIEATLVRALRLKETAEDRSDTQMKRGITSKMPRGHEKDETMLFAYVSFLITTLTIVNCCAFYTR